MKILSATRSKVDKLADAIGRARVAYYRGRPTMTDEQYDKLEEELRALEPRHPVLKFSGAIVPTKMKVKLPYRMPSLTKNKYATGSVGTWLQRNPGPYCVSWKADGVSALRQKENAVDRLFTRGRSGDSEGGDITFLLPHLKRVPDPKAEHVVRGEILMENGRFDARWASEFKNPRNMAAGITNRKDIHKAVADLDFLAYELLVPRMKPSAAFAKLKALGYKTVPYKVMQTLDEEKLLKLLKAARANGKYEVDGLVISVDRKFPLSSNDPDHTFAFKSDTEDEAMETTVTDIEWRITRTGIYFPRLIVEPVRIKGVTVTYASGKSAEFVKNTKLGRGAVIRLRRSGDVIPDLTAADVLKPGKPTWPDEYEWHGANIRPPKGDYQHTDKQTVLALEHFFTVLGIEQFKASTIAKFAEAGYNTPRKILALPLSKFMAVPGVNKTMTVVHKQLQDLKTSGTELPTLMYASGLFGRAFGSRKLGAIVEAIPNIMDKASMNLQALTVMVDDVPGFDVKQASAFALNLPRFVKFAAAIGIPIIKAKAVRAVSTKLKGVAVLFTGFRDSDLEATIVKNGGSLASTIKSATVLVVKDPSSGSAKLNAARQLGTRILTAQQFRKAYGL